MSINHFEKLLDLLNTRLIMFVDDDFALPKNPETILSAAVYLNMQDCNLLKNEVIFTDLKEDINKLIDFICLFQSKEHSDNVIPLIQTGEILEYLDSMIIHDSTFEELKSRANELIVDLSRYLNDDISEIYLKYGITDGNVPSNYVPFLEAVKSKMPIQCSVRIYKKPQNLTLIREETKLFLKDFPHEYCLSLVDRNLGKNDEEGTQFINDVLIPLKDVINVASIIYTSKNNHGHKKADQYHYIEVSKSDLDATEKIISGLATCVYSNLFKSLKNIIINSVDKTFELALNSKDNMLYLSRKAGLEGITTYEAITHWTSLMQNQLVLNKLLEKNNNTSAYNLIVGLASMLADDNITTRENLDPDFQDAVRQLNRAEIFDYNVNKRHLPPQPGDIFYDGNQYYVLIDQECDCTIRDKSFTRKNTHATLVCAKFNLEVLLEKIDKTNWGNGELKLNFFQDSNGKTGSLTIQFGKSVTADYLVLDLSAFNEDGKCKYVDSEKLPVQIEKLLPLPWTAHYENIKSSIMSCQSIVESLSSTQTSLKSLNLPEFSLLLGDFESKNATYPIKRVCSITNSFKGYIIKSFYDYRGRVGLNTIAPSEAQKISITEIDHGIHNKMTSVEVQIDAYLLQGKNISSSFKELPLSLNIADLSKALPGVQLPIHLTTIVMEGVSFFDEKTGLKILRQNLKNQVKLKLIFPVLKFRDKNTCLLYMTLEELLSELEDEISHSCPVGEVLSVHYSDNKELVSEIHRFGFSGKITLASDLKRGIDIEQFGIRIYANTRDQIIVESIDKVEAAASKTSPNN